MNQANFDSLMWSAIEGALGSTKAAALRHLPLSTLVANKLASDGIVMTDTVTLGDAAGYVGRKLAMARRENETITNGLAALRELQGSTKTASTAPASPTASLGLFEKIAHAYKLHAMLPYTSAGVRDEVKEAFDQTALEIYDTMYKWAGALQGLPPADSPARSLKEQSVDLAQGVANIPLLQQSMEGEDKVASAEAFDDLVTTVYLDWQLRHDSSIEKVAEVRRLNREYGVQLLFRALT